MFDDRVVLKTGKIICKDGGQYLSSLSELVSAFLLIDKK